MRDTSPKSTLKYFLGNHFPEVDPEEVSQNERGLLILLFALLLTLLLDV